MKNYTEDKVASFIKSNPKKRHVVTVDGTIVTMHDSRPVQAGDIEVGKVYRLKPSPCGKHSIMEEVKNHDK